MSAAGPGDAEAAGDVMPADNAPGVTNVVEDDATDWLVAGSG